MRFQRVLFPTVCDCKQLYFNGDFEVTNEGVLVISKNKKLESDTYFNSISVKKFKKYVGADSLTIHAVIRGIFKFYSCGAWIDTSNIIRRADHNSTQHGHVGEVTEIDIPIVLDDSFEISYFKIETISDCEILEMYYECTPHDVNDIKLAVGICTFKREDFINTNLARMASSKLFDSPDKPHVFVCDNAKTLSCPGYDWVSLIPNKNVGGSGGFTRCMVEIKRSSIKFTHFILMDDDINLDPLVIERVFDLLRCLKKEFMESIIGGSMFVLHEPWRQFEAGGLYKYGNMTFPNKLMDMRPIRHVIYNTKENKLNYNAWCFCCMPVSVFDSGLPLPIFIHMDDVEYGTRLGRNIIQTSGIAVWHPYYPNQRSSSIVFYDIRNRLIVLSRDLKVDLTKYALNLLQGFLQFIYRYDYNRFLAAIDGFKAYLSGIDNLKTVDPVKLNSSLQKYRVVWKDLPVDMEYSLSKISDLKIPHGRHETKDYFALKRKESTIYYDCDITAANPNGYRNMVLINKYTNKYATFSYDARMAKKCLNEYHKMKKRLKGELIDVSKVWHQRYYELTEDDFWDKYLQEGE